MGVQGALHLSESGPLFGNILNEVLCLQLIEVVQ